MTERLTKGELENAIESVNRMSNRELRLGRRNGYYAIDEATNKGWGIDNLCCGSLNECYCFIRGMRNVYNR